MTDQKSEHARRPGPLHISALVRRAASSTKSMLRGDPIKLKQGLDGIRAWTARLPVLLDSPRWRAPLPNLTELSPGWRRHDRTHLEIKNLRRDDHVIDETSTNPMAVSDVVGQRQQGQPL